MAVGQHANLRQWCSVELLYQEGGQEIVCRAFPLECDLFTEEVIELRVLLRCIRQLLWGERPRADRLQRVAPTSDVIGVAGVHTKEMTGRQDRQRGRELLYDVDGLIRGN